jgi:hypothetical protein
MPSRRMMKKLAEARKAAALAQEIANSKVVGAQWVFPQRPNAHLVGVPAPARSYTNVSFAATSENEPWQEVMSKTARRNVTKNERQRKWLEVGYEDNHANDELWYKHCVRHDWEEEERKRQEAKRRERERQRSGVDEEEHEPTRFRRTLA